MKACPHCQNLVTRAPDTCPHCGGTLHGTLASRSAAAMLLGLTLVATGCPPGKDGDVQALYGVIDTSDEVDGDGDGWTMREGDCDDADETRHPDATETAGDDIDSNCDGEDDT